MVESCSNKFIIKEKHQQLFPTPLNTLILIILINHKILPVTVKNHQQKVFDKNYINIKTKKHQVVFGNLHG
jgi:hypothetical protein